MIFDILTIFPEFFAGPLQEGILRRALLQRQITVNLVNIRDFASAPHFVTDDRPFGGGEGMVMKPEPLAKAVESRFVGSERPKVVFLSPQGRRLRQSIARRYAEEDKHLILLCGRYEGVDERFLWRYVDEEISLGDYVLSGGELAAMVVVDAVTRLLPGVLGCSDSAKKDTFSRGLLKHAQFTRPRRFSGVEVPADLLSGDHCRIEQWRFLNAVQRTLERRPDLLASTEFTSAERELLQRQGLWAEIEKLQKAG
ncbi:MAG: tRNA (guanosine(37)-N1)-methyltransferase TrmD [Deltaproteobacteria bacterium]|nr:MAG: tRNA (guanosine(37)-N1)-methyltransferase TrmD [Deltaproteobacteria bacterium]